MPDPCGLSPHASAVAHRVNRIQFASFPESLNQTIRLRAYVYPDNRETGIAQDPAMRRAHLDLADNGFLDRHSSAIRGDSDLAGMGK